MLAEVEHATQVADLGVGGFEFVHSIREMAARLDCRVVAEGIEFTPLL